MSMDIGTADPLSRLHREEHPEFCGENCDCGHWRSGRYATMNVDGRRGKVTLDVIDNGDDRGSR